VRVDRPVPWSRLKAVEGGAAKSLSLLPALKPPSQMVVEHVCHKRQVGLYSLSGPFAFHAFKSTAGLVRFQCTCNAYSVQVQ
jgi:hypothetical protein